VSQAAEAHGGFARASNAPAGGGCLEVGFGTYSTTATPERLAATAGE